MVARRVTNCTVVNWCSAAERDQANRDLMAAERERLLAERDRSRAKLLGQSSRLWRTERKLADLAVIARTLAENPDAKLLFLDVRSEPRTMTAIALGDPDAARHIAVTTPGANAAVSSAAAPFSEVVWNLPKFIDEARALKENAEQVARRCGAQGAAVATIIWLGYQSPNPDGPNHRARLSGRYGVYATRRARAGAGALSTFYQGLAVRDPAPHLVAIGHSYGSLLTALALRLTPPGMVSDVVFCGSPGIPENSGEGAAQLHMADGHVYAMMSDDDEIRDWFPLLRRVIYGVEPTAMPWVVSLPTGSGIGPGDGVHHAAPPTHADYPTSYDSDGDGVPDRLHMSGHNLACVVVGRADLAAREI
ncbi:alpha/beta hydrolase [Segniliparus rotundus]|nr:alpha/beta hydrolase [Segniliparus rotundus]